VTFRFKTTRVGKSRGSWLTLVHLEMVYGCWLDNIKGIRPANIAVAPLGFPLSMNFR